MDSSRTITLAGSKQMNRNSAPFDDRVVSFWHCHNGLETQLCVIVLKGFRKIEASQYLQSDQYRRPSGQLAENGVRGKRHPPSARNV